FVSKRPSSHRRDKSLAAHWLNAFGDQPLHTIGPAMIVDYKVQRRAEGAAPRTINLELSLLHHAWNKAKKEWEWVEDNPVAKVSRETAVGSFTSVVAGNFDLCAEHRLTARGDPGPSMADGRFISQHADHRGTKESGH
ncbi:MAG: phage integrase, partial [Nitrospirales bacterium]